MPGFYRLLLVEDNSDDVFLFMKSAARALPTFQVSVAGDGEDARQLLTDKTAVIPDLIVTDIKMPRWNGFDLVRWIRSQPDLKSIPTCVLTSSPEPKDVELGYGCGADLYLLKPTGYREYADLLELIRQFWEHPAKLPKSHLVRTRSNSGLTPA